MSSSSPALILPCAMSISISGTSCSSFLLVSSSVSTRLCKKNTWPPRSTSCRIALATRSSLYESMTVSIACLFCGGVLRILMSRILSILMCNVRGIGVALIASESMFVFSSLRRSLSFTPKRCSSSIIISPKSLKTTSFWIMRWVPMIMSSSPFLSFSSVFFCSAGGINLESCAIFTGKFSKRSTQFS